MLFDSTVVLFGTAYEVSWRVRARTDALSRRRRVRNSPRIFGIHMSCTENDVGSPVFHWV